ncbi:MAG: endonuclease/exonuclease/phosphatase family protein [Streptosporangiaceae bacterium]|nr:endonuclease/exonuclease/phosphatase family protein [Streptosporangiaceae bacterium]
MKVPGKQLTVVSFNTRGIPVTGSRLAMRYAAIGAELEAGDADVVCFQEIFTYWHLRLLARRMRSFRHVSYLPSVAAPAGGLVTFSRLPVSAPVYRGFGIPPRAPGISGLTRLQAWMKGALVVRLRGPGLCVVNTHPVANRDGDWSEQNRFYAVHRAQLDALTRAVRAVPAPVVVCGDFNIARDSSLFGRFVASAGLADAFEGRCPATFRAEYLPAGATPHCIDFILTSAGVRAESATALFTGKVPLPGGPGYLSDHLGLCATLLFSAGRPDGKAPDGRLPAGRPGGGAPGAVR